MGALLKAALSPGGHTHANSYSLKKGRKREKMRSLRGGMKKRCVVQEDKEPGSLIYLFYQNPKGSLGQHAASVNRDTTSSVHLQ